MDALTSKCDVHSHMLLEIATKQQCVDMYDPNTGKDTHVLLWPAAWLWCPGQGIYPSCRQSLSQAQRLLLCRALPAPYRCSNSGPNASPLPLLQVWTVDKELKGWPAAQKKFFDAGQVSTLRPLSQHTWSWHHRWLAGLLCAALTCTTREMRHRSYMCSYTCSYIAHSACMQAHTHMGGACLAAVCFVCVCPGQKYMLT